MSMALKASKASSGANSGGAFISRSQFQGDPGLFGFLGKAAGGILRTAGKLLPGPAGFAAGALGGALAGGPGRTPSISQVSQRPIPFNPFGAKPVQQAPPIRLGPIGINPGAIAPGGKPFISTVQDAGVACPSGFHPNKSDYFLKDGTFVPKGSRCVKNRRRNALNPRAASRAISRIESAKKATKALDRVSVKCRRCFKVNCSCR